MLIVHLPVTFQGEYDVFRRPPLQTPVWVGRGSAAEFSASTDECVAVIPWQRMAWHTVLVPPKVGKRWALVLQGLLGLLRVAEVLLRQHLRVVEEHLLQVRVLLRQPVLQCICLYFYIFLTH